MSTNLSLMKSRRFLPLFITQFFGAFNDNTFKNALVVLLTYQATQWTTMKPGILANLAAGIFILPFFLFSATAGQLADKYDKSRLARLVKILEIVIMLVAGAGFALHSLAWLMFALLLLGVHSTIFGPIKYALLPQHLGADELLAGNALIEAGTFVSILLGTLAGGMLAGTGNPTVIAAAGLVVAVIGYLSSRAIPSAPAPQPDLPIHPNPLSETWRNIGFARQNRSVFLSILGISWFWLFGALFLAQFPAYAKTVLGGDESSVTLLLATFTIGVGLGSMVCERLSGDHVEIGLVPLGSIGLTLFGLDLSWASPSSVHVGTAYTVGQLLGFSSTWHILADLLLIGLFGGFFIVPLYALIQMRSPENCRARIIAANNIMNALFMVGGSVAAAGLLSAGFSIPALFASAALLNAAVAAYIYRLVPEFLVRFVVWLVLHTVGRIEANGLEQIPKEGGALLVIDTDDSPRPLDVLKVMAVCKRPIRFVVDKHWDRNPVYGLVLGEARAIYASHEDSGAQTDAIGLARQSLSAGQLVALAHHPTDPLTLLDGIEVPMLRVTLRSGHPEHVGQNRRQAWLTRTRLLVTPMLPAQESRGP